MKILLTNFTLGSMGGTQTWVLTMAKELNRLGHQVFLFAGDNDYKIISTEFTIFNPELEYDIAFINHNTCLTAMDGVKIKKKVFTSHGIIPELEQPIKGADIYVGVSEEVQENLAKQGFESTVIRNPIDLEIFTSSHRMFTHFPQPLKKVLYMSNYQGGVLQVIQDACKEMNIDLHVFGKSNQISNVKAELNWADLVIGLGRTAYEAMACNKNVIILDYNGADGFVTPEVMPEFRKNNCSGRRYGIKLDSKGLQDLFKQYNPRILLRPYIEENNDVVKIVQQYLDLVQNFVSTAKKTEKKEVEKEIVKEEVKVTPKAPEKSKGVNRVSERGTL